MPPRPRVLGPGDLLAGRYRLEEHVARSRTSDLWRATDEVLARPVAAKVARVPAEGFVAAAARAGAVAHPGLVRIYDAALEDVGGTDVAYVISEWVLGRPLPAVLAEAPLAVATAAALGVEAAEAVAVAHAAGLPHGRLHPGNLLVTPAGRVRLTDTAVAAALRDRVGTTADDTRDLAALLYAALTGRWPDVATPQPARGLPSAPTVGAEPCSPRQVRAGVPRALDGVVTRTLVATPHPVAEVPSAAGFAAALAHASAAPAPGASRDPRRERLARALSPLRRAFPWMVVAAGLLVVYAVTFSLGRSVGALPARPGEVDAAAQPSPTASGLALRALDLGAPPVAVHDFDPEGDGTENHSQVVNAFDKDSSTAWFTSRYSSERFGSLKTGVGLLVDLGQPRVIGRVEVLLTTGGADVELRAGSTSSPLPPVVASAQAVGGGKPVVLTPASATAQRYWVLWLTRLPADPGGGYREGVSELTFFGGAA